MRPAREFAIRDRQGAQVGQIEIDGLLLSSLGEQEVAAVAKVAKELGELWPE